MYITRIRADGPQPLGELDLNCDRQVNLLIGPNASGKSTILRAIREIFAIPKTDNLRQSNLGWVEDDPREPGRAITGNGWFFSLKARIDPNEYPRGFVETPLWDWATVPVLYVPPTRVNLPSQNLFDDSIASAVDLPLDNPGMDREFDPRANIFYGPAITRILKGGDWQEMEQAEKALRVGYSCARSICPEILRGETPQSYTLVVGGERDDLPGLGIPISENFLAPTIYAGALSSGTQVTLLWVWALALRIGWFYKFTRGWEKGPAILLIDEIENHLHPTWQRRVIPALLKHFPNLQIFATTHSPFVVAGLKKGQVHLLKRDENGVVTASLNEEAIIGWTADEILRTIMGVDEPTDQLTVDRTRRLRELRRKEKLTSEEESELRTLRRQVSEALLFKGGPMEAQRERYSDLMQRFLLSRQSDSSQDGE